ncbi:MAG TPA: hypothetical protein VJJ02_05205 [Candidatus Paceibacterota bacterium]
MADDPNRWDVADISNKISQRYKFYIDADALSDIDWKANAKEVPGNYGSTHFELPDKKFARALTKINKLSDVNTHFPDGKRLIRECAGLLDNISDGRFLDNHNLNHIVLGVGARKETRHFVGKAFDKYSKIQGSDDGGGTFWASTYESVYALGLTQPVVIMSPNDPSFRQVIKNTFQPTGETIYESVLTRMRDAEEYGKKKLNPERYTVRRQFQDLMVFDEKGTFTGFNIDHRHSFDALTRLFILAGLPIGESKEGTMPGTLMFTFKDKNGGGTNASDFTWADISDCIVDLRARKMWTKKYTTEEQSQVEQDKKHFVDWIEKNILGSSLGEAIAERQTEMAKEAEKIVQLKQVLETLRTNLGTRYGFEKSEFPRLLGVSEEVASSYFSDLEKRDLIDRVYNRFTWKLSSAGEKLVTGETAD